MFVFHILLDGQQEPYHVSHTAVDADTWHRRMDSCRPRAFKQPAPELTTRVNGIDTSGAGTPSATGYKPDDSRTHETADLGTAKSVVGTGINPNVIAGAFMSTQEITTGMVLETHGITDMCPTKTSSEVRPVQIAKDPDLSTKDITLFRSSRGSLPSLSRCTTIGLIYSEDAGHGDDSTADVDTDLAGDVEKEYSTTRVVACLAGASVD